MLLAARLGAAFGRAVPKGLKISLEPDEFPGDSNLPDEKLDLQFGDGVGSALEARREGVPYLSSSRA